MSRVLVALAILLPAMSAAALPANFDALALSPADREVDEKAVPARERVLHQEPRLGLPTFLWAAFAPRGQGRLPARWEQAASEHLARHLDLYRLTDDVHAGLRVESLHDVGRGPVVVTFRRQIDGIPVFRDAVRVVLDRQRELVAIAGYLPGGQPSTQTFSIEAAAAVALAAADLGATLPAANLAAVEADGAGFARFEAPGLGRPARVRRVYFHLPDELLPAWHVELQIDDAHFAWVIDAGEGGVLYRRDLVQDASYRVWADADAGSLPFDGPQGTEGSPHPTASPDGWQAPFLAPGLISLESGPISTGDPWLPSGATETLGNNVDAYVDRSAPDGLGGGDFRATVTSPGVFDHVYDLEADPRASRKQGMASVTQLFYVANWMHDWFYDAGFDEAAGNAQDDNLGRGGVARDRLLAEAQDFSGRNNASMATPADGGSPQMQFHIFDANFSRRLSVIEPAQAVDSFNVGLAAFGPAAFDVTAPLAVGHDGIGTSTDACEPLQGDLAGKVVLIDRGLCPFADKAMNAENAGAVGVVIINNEDGSAPGMSGDDAGHQIAVVSVSRADGQKLRAAPDALVQLLREAAIDRDSSIDTSVVAHEFAHMITNRLIGNASGLGNNQGGSMGEGWSDFVALLLLARPEDASVGANVDFGGAYAIGSWVHSGGETNGYYYGMRRYPYSADFARNPLTFRHVMNDEEMPPVVPLAYGRSGRFNAQVHRSGEVWATLLWECYVALLRHDEPGDFEEARQLMLELLVASLKITPADPTFLEARDALLAAAWAHDPSVYRLFWEAFARRGAGLHAVAPDRWSGTHAGTQESFVAGNGVQLAGVVVDDGDACDGDGILDAGESGFLRLQLRNDGVGPLEATTVRLTSSTPGISLGDGLSVPVPASNPLETVAVEVPIALATAAGITLLEVDIVVSDPALPADRHFSWAAWMHYDERPARTTVDQVETARTVWQVDNDTARAPRTSWTRTFVQGEGFRWSAPAPGARVDHRLVSPPLQVSATRPLHLEFRHRHRFEVRNDFFIDGGAIEISSDGQTWQPVDAGYPGSIPFVVVTALRGRDAFVGQNAAWPAMETKMVDLGMAFAGQSVRLRFRLATDVVAGDHGWDIDDIAFSGIDNLPFPAAEPEDQHCGNTAPVAVIIAPQSIDEDRETRLDGSASHDVDWDPLTFAWSQLSGPEVEWLDATSAVARLRTPAVSGDDVIVVRLEVSDGALSHATTRTLALREVHLPPLALVASPIEARVGSLVVLDASASHDPEGEPVTFAWTQADGPEITLDDAAAAAPTFQAPLEVTTLRFVLVVSDGRLQSEPLDVVVEVVPENRPPEVTVEPSLAVDERARVQLPAAVGSDPDGDEITFRWSQLGGTAGVLEDAESAAPTLAAPDVDGDETLIFAVVSFDGEMASEPAILEVLVREVNRQPIVALVPQLHVTVGKAVTIDASASEDPDGEPLVFQWRQVDGPAVSFERDDQATLQFEAPDEPAVLAFELEVSDPRGGTAQGDVVVHVSTARPDPGCGCSGSGSSGALQLGAFAAVALALRRRRPLHG